VKILNPAAATRADHARPLPLAPILKGIRIAILTNHWKSMDRIAQWMSAELKKSHLVSDVRFYDIPINGAMSEATERGVLGECDAAIVGLAN
jgi:hypothetical protein